MCLNILARAKELIKVTRLAGFSKEFVISYIVGTQQYGYFDSWKGHA